jgi:hypothetical protein
MREQAVRENRPSMTSDKINIKVEIIEFVKSQLKVHKSGITLITSRGYGG